MGGRVVHFEMPFDSAARARSFYGSVFGWELTAMPEPGYLLAMTGPTPEDGPPAEPGFINGGLVAREDSVGRAPAIVIDVDDIDAALELVEKHGGRPVLEKQEVGDMGFTAYFEDSEGNIVGLWETRAPSTTDAT